MRYNNYRRQEPTVGYINLMMSTSPRVLSGLPKGVYARFAVVTEP